MIAGPPNGGKSLLALWYVVKHNLPTLFFSADTDAWTTVLRASAMRTGVRIPVIEHELDTDEGWEEYGWVLGTLDNVRFAFEPTPSLDDIDLELLAYKEIWGTWPELIIVDNLMNVQAERDDEWGGLREISKALHHIARKTDAAVWVLHHVSEGGEGRYQVRPDKPAPRRAIQGKISQLPEMILTVAMEPVRGLYHVAVVKNRSGPHDPTGETFETLYVVPDRMLLFEELGEARLAEARGVFA